MEDKNNFVCIHKRISFCDVTMAACKEDCKANGKCSECVNWGRLESISHCQECKRRRKIEE